MRLVSEFETEQQAFQFSSLLAREGIQCSYEPARDGAPRYQVWIIEEEDYERASQLFSEFEKNPSAIPETSLTPPPPKPQTTSSQKKISVWKIRLDLRPRQTLFSLTGLFLILCALIFVMNYAQVMKSREKFGRAAASILFTPIEKTLLFDYPSNMEKLEELIERNPPQNEEELAALAQQGNEDLLQDAPVWIGLTDLAIHWKETGWNYLKQVTFFTKIGQGEVWRIFTPCILHRDFLHILFNMLWLWVLGKQIEQRAGRLRMLCLFLIVGSVSNVAQYLMGGPFFLGFSGIVVGMAGFIWTRQKVAPWEGYPLPRGTLLFILIFVVAMFVIGLLSFFLQFFSLSFLNFTIANTAHIIGGVTGILLGRVPAFGKRVKT